MLLLFNTITIEPLVLYSKSYFMCKGFIQNLPNTVSTEYFSSTGPKKKHGSHSILTMQTCLTSAYMLSHDTCI